MSAMNVQATLQFHSKKISQTDHSSVKDIEAKALFSIQNQNTLLILATSLRILTVLKKFFTV